MKDEVIWATLLFEMVVIALLSLRSPEVSKTRFEILETRVTTLYKIVEGNKQIAEIDDRTLETKFRLKNSQDSAVAK